MPTNLRVQSSEFIDETIRVSFKFNGKTYYGFKGDTLASALLANDIHLVGRSFKYHRPRGIMTAGSEEPNAIVQVNDKTNRTEPNVRATELEIYEGLEASSQNCWPSVNFDIGGINNVISAFLPAGFYYKTFMWPASFWEKYEFFIRHSAGLGKSPADKDPDIYDHRYIHCDVLVVGAGISGILAAKNAAKNNFKTLLVDEKNELGGSTIYQNREFNKIENPNIKMIFDLANFYKNSKNYEKAIDRYTEIILTLDDNSLIKSDVLYRRGGSYERMGNYEKSDEDLLHALKIDPSDAYILNYLAYSWLERDYKINEAMDMLKTAYDLKSNDPYIIDSIGWAYFLIEDYVEAEKYLKRAVELMPDDPIVNDHYGDILWKLNRKIQARYFWNNVLTFDDTEDDMREKINIKVIEGLKNS